MKYILLLFFVLFPISISHSQNNMMIRNTSLRFLIAVNYKKYKNSLINTKNIFLSKFYQTYDNSKSLYVEYYTLNEDDRLVIETILGLIF